MDKLMRKFESMEPEERRRMKTMLAEKSSERRGEGGEGGGGEGGGKVNWMYKQEKPDTEEYLLGRRIDKHVEQLQPEVDKNAPGSKFQEVIARRTEMDMNTKMREDPLFAIRARETDAKRKLLQNPIKLKQIQKLISDREEEEQKIKKEKKKSKKKKKDKDTDILLQKYLSIVNKDKTKSKEHRTSKHSHDSDDSSSEKKVKPKNYGLIDAESGEKIELKKKRRSTSPAPSSSERGHRRDRERSPARSRGHCNREYDPRDHRSHRTRRSRSRSRSPRRRETKKKLTREEMAAKREQMSSSAQWRNEQREENVKAYAETSRLDDQKEEMDGKGKGGSFVKPMMMQASTSVEDRIKRSMFNVQRTRADIDGNFLRK